MENFKQIVVILKDYVPVFTTCLQYGFWILVILISRKKLFELVDVIKNRVKDGSDLKAGPFELKNIPSVDKAGRTTSSRIQVHDKVAALTNQERDGIYQKNRGVFLAHTVLPSNLAGFDINVYIYLIEHVKGEKGKIRNISQVKKAEFFFGREWNNKVFETTNNSEPIGISTAAYAPFLAICLVTFDDDQTVLLHRYIDFNL